MAASSDQPSFSPSNVDAGFQSRRNAIFAGLTDLEKKHEKEISTDDPFAENFDAERLRNRRPKRVPDHVLHPQKWQKYSLEEDGTDSKDYESVSGDNLNKRIATNFLQELADRKKKEKKDDDDDDYDLEAMDTNEKVVFQKPENLKRKLEDLENDDTRAEKDDFNESQRSGCCIRMKTYEFGQKSQKPQKDEKPVDKIKTSIELSGKELALSHLEENDEEGKSKESNVGNHIEIEKVKPKFDEHRKIKRNIRKPVVEED